MANGDDTLINTLTKRKQLFHKVVPFDTFRDKLLLIDFTAATNYQFADVINDTAQFTDYIQKILQQTHSRYGIGGYNEHRTIYTRSDIFNNDKSLVAAGNKNVEPRRLHLGIDIWGNASVPVYVPIGGVIHSFAFNNTHGDYGATIILQHQLDTVVFHTLYGHLSLKDLDGLKEGKFVSQGETIGHFGEPHENGQWPPHLHFQIIKDMRVMKGDYPGVCKFSEREQYLQNCPNPDLILHMMQYAGNA
jgi:murein DD-endopeptidase MepM/ murein hydrolase activator NlpD